MQRRSFLKRLAGVFTAAVVSESVIPDDGVALRSMAHPLNPDVPSHNFASDTDTGLFSKGADQLGFAPIKAEGGVIAYDHLNAFDAIRDGVTDELLGPFETIEMEFDEGLDYGLNDAFAENYDDLEPDNWQR